MDNLNQGEETIITKNDLPVARLVGAMTSGAKAVFGAGKGKMEILDEDDEHLEHFKEYMP